MQNDRNTINNGKKWNNEEGKTFIFYPYMLMINLKRNPPLTCKIEEKPSNQQKQTTKPNKKLGEIVPKNAKMI